MIERVIPNIEQSNDHGSCWTCLDKGRYCDRSLPDCNTCLCSGQKCHGYGLRLDWPSSTRRSGRRTNKPRRQPLVKVLSPSLTTSFFPRGLSSSENEYLNHYLRYISQIALAVDYTENGYRMLLPMAAEEPALLNAMLAVAASHKSRWQQVEDTESRKFLRKALLRLQEIISDPKDAVKESTLAVIMTLVCYDVFNGTGRWKQHFQGVGDLLRFRGDCSDLSSFIKTWICMIDTQSALNLGQATISEVEEWLEGSAWDASPDRPVIDALFGCSTKLPSLMLEAARLYRLSRSDGATGPEIQRSLRERAAILKVKIQSAKLNIQSTPSLAVTCGRSELVATAVGNGLDYLRRMCATAEIFRHALLIYLFRVVNGPQVALDIETQQSLDEAFSLLLLVPDAIGPGANLGWALVILGSEMDLPDLRQYIHCRWQGLKLLEMHNTQSGEKLTEEIWRQRDEWGGGQRVLWQDVMRRLDDESILV